MEVCPPLNFCSGTKDEQKIYTERCLSLKHIAVVVFCFFKVKILSELEYGLKFNIKAKLLLYFVFKKINGFLM